MKKHLILLGVLLCSQLSMAEDLAPTKTKIISQDDSIAWVKFRDNSDGDFFRFYLDGKTNSAVIGDRKDTTWRNGKSRVVPFKLKKLDPKTYKVTIGVIKDNKKVAESTPFDLVIGGGGDDGDSSQAPTISKVFKGSERYTWVKFKDNSDGDFFRFYFNGEVNNRAIKDYNDTKVKNGKYRVVPINITKLALNTKFDVTIGVIKDGQKIAESKAFTIETGDYVNLTRKVIEYNREHGDFGDDFLYRIKVYFYFDHHLAMIRGYEGGQAWDIFNFYRIDDNNNIKPIPILPFRELNPREGQSLVLSEYGNGKKLSTIEILRGGQVLCNYYDVSDLDNIRKIGELTLKAGTPCANYEM